jgi:hypothetical protein
MALAGRKYPNGATPNVTGSARRRSVVVLPLIETWSHQNAGPNVGVAAHINAPNVKNAGNLVVACQILFNGRILSGRVSGCPAIFEKCQKRSFRFRSLTASRKQVPTAGQTPQFE